MCSSRCSFPVSIVAMSISAVTSDSTGFSASTIDPLTPWNLPRTLDTIMCRTVNETSEWTGSMDHVPATKPGMEMVDCLGIVPPSARYRVCRRLPLMSGRETGAGGTMGAYEEGRQRLVTIVRHQAAEAECWERAETVLRASTLRERLTELGIELTPDIACALMAAGMVMASGSPEFGGDYRDALGDLTAVGLTLLDD